MTIIAHTCISNDIEYNTLFFTIRFIDIMTNVEKIIDARIEKCITVQYSK